MTNPIVTKSKVHECTLLVESGCLAELLEEIPGIYFSAHVNHLKVKVSSGGISSGSQSADALALIYTLPASNTDGVKVGIERLPAIAMINHYQVPIPVVAPPGIYYDAIV